MGNTIILKIQQLKLDLMNLNKEIGDLTDTLETLGFYDEIEQKTIINSFCVLKNKIGHVLTEILKSDMNEFISDYYNHKELVVNNDDADNSVPDVSARKECLFKDNNIEIYLYKDKEAFYYHNLLMKQRNFNISNEKERINGTIRVEYTINNIEESQSLLKPSSEFNVLL